MYIIEYSTRDNIEYVDDYYFNDINKAIKLLMAEGYTHWEDDIYSYVNGKGIRFFAEIKELELYKD